MEWSKQLSRLTKTLIHAKYEVAILIASILILWAATNLDFEESRWEVTKITSNFTAGPEVETGEDFVAVAVPQKNDVLIQKYSTPILSDPKPIDTDTVSTGGPNRFLSLKTDGNNLSISVQNGTLGNRQLSFISTGEEGYHKTVVERTDTVGQNPGAYSAIAGPNNRQIYFTSDREKSLMKAKPDGRSHRLVQNNSGLFTEAINGCKNEKQFYVTAKRPGFSIILGGPKGRQTFDIKAASLDITLEQCRPLAVAKTMNDKIAVVTQKSSRNISDLRRGRVAVSNDANNTILFSNIYENEIKTLNPTTGKETLITEQEIEVGYVDISSLKQNKFAVFTTSNGVYLATKYSKDERRKRDIKKVGASLSGILLITSLLALLRSHLKIRRKS